MSKNPPPVAAVSGYALSPAEMHYFPLPLEVFQWESFRNMDHFIVYPSSTFSNSRKQIMEFQIPLELSDLDLK